MLHGPHNGPHVSQLSRTHQKLLKSHEPLIASQLSDSVETNDVVMEIAIQDMINDWFMDEGEEDPCGHFNSKDGDDTYNKVKKEAQIPVYNGAKVSKLSATLLLLNLQTTYGWSDNSLDSLFRYI